MIKRALLALVGAAAIMAAAGVTVIAAAFALYALLSDSLGAAGAAAVVAAIAALIVIVGALIALLKARGPSRRHGAEDASLQGRVIALARQHPVLAAGGALVVGIIAFRNPKLVTALVTGMLAGKAAPKN